MAEDQILSNEAAGNVEAAQAGVEAGPEAGVDGVAGDALLDAASAN